MVWIAETIRPEHKSAIDFLNQNLKETLGLYAVEASAIRIDESKPAFVLTLVSMPSEVSIVSEISPGPSETKERYRTYFQTLIDELRETHKRGGLTVGIASNEVRRFGLNVNKRSRLIRAGADIIMPDFSQMKDLLAILFKE